MSEERNVVYVGRKPVMNYVLAIITYFNSADATEVTLKARGRAITTAVDVAEITRRRFLEKVKVDDITIGTVELPGEGGRTRAVSTTRCRPACTPAVPRRRCDRGASTRPIRACRISPTRTPSSSP